MNPAVPPNPEVSALPQRRQFSAVYKLAILKEAEACRLPGELGALLRREGLYSSHRRDWRKQYERGALQALTPKERGRKAEAVHPLLRRVAELEEEKRQLEHRRKQADTIIEFQKKISEILGIPLSEGPRVQRNS